MEQDHSQQSWYPFFAYAELLVENSDVCLVAHAGELSREGCHLHLTDRVPTGTSVVVKIYAWPHFFQARGTICYSENRIGVGINFEKIESDYVSVLEASLIEAEAQQRKATADNRM
jgi:hypothetical protein